MKLIGCASSDARARPHACPPRVRGDTRGTFLLTITFACSDHLRFWRSPSLVAIGFLLATAFPHIPRQTLSYGSSLYAASN
ncbi:unnamed protein product [[Actinomadura] parvosata subsp. kistnae]|nr:unnamed protein product [Actinomadura parvosata subsp. kistnae]